MLFFNVLSIRSQFAWSLLRWIWETHFSLQRIQNVFEIICYCRAFLVFIGFLHTRLLKCQNYKILSSSSVFFFSKTTRSRISGLYVLYLCFTTLLFCSYQISHSLVLNEYLWGMCEPISPEEVERTSNQMYFVRRVLFCFTAYDSISASSRAYWELRWLPQNQSVFQLLCLPVLYPFGGTQAQTIINNQIF